MAIDKSNIAKFISHLYREKKHHEPPHELLQSWENLSNEEIDTNLSGLFASWGMSEADKLSAIQRFITSQNLSSYATQSNVTTTSINPNSSPSQFTQKKKNKNKPILLLLIVLPLFLIISYLAYQYFSFNNLDRVYAITQNIAIRDGKGKMVGRMDLYEDSTLGSYSSLRAVDNEIYYIQPEGSDKEYPCRKLIPDSITFTNFLLGSDYEVYVNVNYLVNDKKEFRLYANAFHEIQTIEKDNSQLKASVRKVIVGSMAATKDMDDKYIITNSEGLNKSYINNTSGIIIQSFKNNQEFVIIAPLNDGHYYRFEGNISTNEFKALTEIQYINEEKNILPLTGNYRFIQSNGVWRLYDVNQKTSTHYSLMKDNNGKFSFFEYNPPEKISTETNLFNELTDVINNIFD